MDSDCLARVLAGDAGIVLSLVDRAWPRATFAYGGPVDRSELRQEAAREVLEAARAWAPDQGDFADVAVVRARRRIEALTRAERRRRPRWLPLEVIGDTHPGGEMRTRFDSQVDSERLGAALGRLSPRQRALIVRAYWQELTAGEIAAQDGISADGVRRAQNRARAALRRELGGRPGAPLGYHGGRT